MCLLMSTLPTQTDGLSEFGEFSRTVCYPCSVNTGMQNTKRCLAYKAGYNSHAAPTATHKIYSYTESLSLIREPHINVKAPLEQDQWFRAKPASRFLGLSAFTVRPSI